MKDPVGVSRNDLVLVLDSIKMNHTMIKNNIAGERKYLNVTVHFRTETITNFI